MMLANIFHASCMCFVVSVLKNRETYSRRYLRVGLGTLNLRATSSAIFVQIYIHTRKHVSLCVFT